MHIAGNCLDFSNSLVLLGLKEELAVAKCEKEMVDAKNACLEKELEVWTAQAALLDELEIE